jgi:hypothetical protein
MQFRPTGEFGFATNKTIMAEFGKWGDFDGITRTRIYGNFVYLQPRMDPFLATGYTDVNGTYSFIPGTQKINTMFNLAFGFGIDMSPEFMNFGKFRPYLGLDISPGFHARHSKIDIPGITNLTEFEVAPFVGFTGRMGAYYSFENSGLFLELQRNYSLILGLAYMNYNTIGIGYYFEF